MTKPLKIALVSQFIGRNDGQGRVTYEIARGALQAGWEVTLIATHCDKDLVGKPGAKFVQIRSASIPTQLLRNAMFAVISGIWLRLNRSTVDIVQVNGCVTVGRSDVNAAHFVHGAWIRNPFYPFRRWWRSPYAAYQRFYSAINARSEIPAFLKSHFVVAVSRKVEAELKSIGVPAERITVIYNGVDTKEFHPGPPERERFGLPEDAPVFLFAGDIRTRRKNLETVLSALALIPKAHLAVAGARKGSPFPSQAEEIRVSHRVHFLGKVSDMAALMRSVDAFVFPSRYECMSLVLLEALATGLPILTAETAGGAEILGNAARILQDPDDVQTLANWMNELCANRQLCREMGRDGRKIALSLNWEVMANQYRALYVLAKSSRIESIRSALLPSQENV